MCVFEPIQFLVLRQNKWSLLPEWFSHAPQVFILLLEPLQFGQDLRELSAWPLWVLAVPYQVPPYVEEQRTPGQQHKGNPTPWARPRSHGLSTVTQKHSGVLVHPRGAGLPAGCLHPLCSPSPQLPQQQSWRRHFGWDDGCWNTDEMEMCWLELRSDESMRSSSPLISQPFCGG